MRANTKESRQQSRDYQFTALINKGYERETYKELDFFTINEGQYFTLKVYRGTAANHIEYVNYRTEQRRAEVIQNYKNSYDRSLAYKEEQKQANNGKAKITLATLKTFLNKNASNIYIKVESRFDGMTDCVERVEDEFRHVTRAESEKVRDYDLGFSGLYLVGSSRDSISAFENEKYTGFHVYNCTGSCTVATPKVQQESQKVNNEQTQPETVSGEINIIDYSEKAFAVTGSAEDLKLIQSKMYDLGGKYNKYLKCGAGYIFSKKKLDEVTAALIGDSEPIQEVKPIEMLLLPAPQITEPETPILPTPQTSIFALDYFKIIWHEGRHIEGATFENATFTSWEDVQKAFVKLWEVNERGQDGGYTKVKCEIKFTDQEIIINRIDITDRIKNGDFNPSQEHIVTYLQSIADEGEIEPIKPNNYETLPEIKAAAQSGKLISLYNLSQLVNHV